MFTLHDEMTLRRWRYSDPNRPADCAYQQQMQQRIERWWKSFAQREPELQALFAGEATWDLAGWMQEHLQDIDPALCWEYGPARTGDGHLLVITPESRHDLRPLVRTLLAQAPDLPGWEFVSARPPQPFAVAETLVQAKTGGSLDEVEVSATIGKYRQIDLTFYSPHVRVRNEGGAMETAFTAAENLLGEDTVERWIGSIRMQPRRSSGPGHFALPAAGDDLQDDLPRVPVVELQPVVNALVDELLEGLPAAPCIDLIDDTTWNVWRSRGTPALNGDFPRRSDLMMLTGCFPEVISATMAGRLFFSSCFSRVGETFCYLKIDGSDGLDASSFADRSAIEDALTHELLSNRLGCVIGGGTGLRYSYIDLALLDLDGSIACLQELLGRAGLPVRTWLLFHDADLASEWVGLYPGTPPPPGLD